MINNIHLLMVSNTFLFITKLVRHLAKKVIEIFNALGT